MISKAYKKIKRFFLNPSNFRITYLLTLYFSNVFLIKNVTVVAQYILMFWAGLIIFFYYIKNRRIYKVRYVKYLLLYLGSITITAVLNITSNFALNMLMVAHIAICFFCFYGMHTEKNKKRIYREIYILAISVVFITFILNLIAFPLACINMHFSFLDNIFIIYKNRFTGFFANPNLLGFISCVAIIFSHFITRPVFAKRARIKIPPKWVLYIMSGFNLICIYLSDSNASFIFILLYLLTYVFFCVFKRQTEINVRQFLLKIFKFVSYAALTCAILISARVITVVSVSQLAALTQVKLPDSITQSVLPDEFDDFSGQDDSILFKDDASQRDKPVSFRHENKNIDSGRIRLFTEALVLIKNYPLFGIGEANLVPYSEEYIDGGLHFSDLHNGYLTIIASSGIVGFIIFVGFAFHLARHVIKSLFIEKKNLRKTIFPCIFAFILAYCVYSFFEITLLYKLSFRVVIFWAMLGYASVYMLKYDHLYDPIVIRISEKKSEPNIDEYDAPTDIENIDDYN